ncbi:TRAP transporter, 4TM/12TM fusion protein [Rhodoferax ferrireducens T118]|uniref:TRAP transporter, 4TM/12TM fusion protein n=1 Tax=Albidiferax ferrireducens (strain ATCC BAA-621 / DSM 15236 / T118) TaxID=338969 RepID=Q21ZM2_ALBFT|nr:TRAP transporter permease [Rhodoferax ferrireducens]ABD68781.1 TRAP transporter, 4TM/12TM fusion protein [Rhodoferax ferrireducens T118]
MTAPTSTHPPVDLQQLVQEADLGGRKPVGAVKVLMFAVCIGWSVLQLWYASPLPFALRFFVLNDTEMRALHLSLALFLAFLAYPFGKRSSRALVPSVDWVLAALAAFCAAYIFLFYRELSTRPGQPTLVDMVVAVAGVLLLLEATRRVVGPPMAVIAALMLAFAFAGPYMPDAVAHKGVSLSKAVSHYWLSTEGVFGVALGVSSSYIFLFVLFGGLLEKAGAGSYFIKIAYALLGHMRGGPAKAAVVSSGLMGMISGSSVANVVTCGTFTIPLMKRVGYPAHKAGAIETAAGVDGQIMPPVMGAAAFLMAEYVGVPYSEIVRNAILPAAISYIALFYIAHLEALKMGIQGLPRNKGSTTTGRLVGFGLTVCSVILLANVVYYGLGWLRTLMGSAAIWLIVPAIVAAYIAIVRQVSKEPDLTIDDPNTAMLVLPPVKETILAGLHYLLPVVLLIWSLLVEELSPGLSAFYASISLVVILLTQKSLLAYFRGQPNPLSRVKDGWKDLVEGLELGARNMIGIGIATACAGIIVGTVSVTGLGLVMTDLVEIVSAGSLIGMLALVAVVCLILGMGMPTTASYIIVSTLMAPVIVELGSQTGLVVPLVAAHMFVFYFGLMADVTPPVGLASFAAAAIAKADPIKTGITAFFYSIRTGILPFMFIFNTELLLIGIRSWWSLALTVSTAIIAMLVFAAATQGWFIRRNRWYESAVLLLVTFSLLRPDFWLDLMTPKYRVEAGTRLVELAGAGTPGVGLRVRIEGTSLEGKSIHKTVLLPLSAEGDGVQRIRNSGMTVMTTPSGVEIMSVNLKSSADKAGFEQGFQVSGVEVPYDRMDKRWLYLPALLLLAAVYAAQRMRPELPVARGRNAAP